MSDCSGLNEKEIYQEVVSRIRERTNNGEHAHMKQIKHIPGMKDYVIMRRWIELETVIELKSEAFSTESEARHFSDCFNDSFLADSEYFEEYGKYYVYSGWLLKDGIMSYSLNSKGAYFEFANWS